MPAFLDTGQAGTWRDMIANSPCLAVTNDVQTKENVMEYAINETVMAQANERLAIDGVMDDLAVMVKRARAIARRTHSIADRAFGPVPVGVEASKDGAPTLHSLLSHLGGELTEIENALSRL